MSFFPALSYTSEVHLCYLVLEVLVSEGAERKENNWSSCSLPLMKPFESSQMEVGSFPSLVGTLGLVI